MRKVANIIRSVIADERGNEMIEYALLLGLIVMAALTIMGGVGGKVLAKWTSINYSL